MSTPLPPRRIAALHDLSCMGRCALTVILPTLSVMGYQVIPIPTALLSTHTGGFTDLHFRDLTADMEAISAHLDALDTSFSALYTGFLGSAEQIDTVLHILDRFGARPDETGTRPLILVDPVMGDDGDLYSTYNEHLVRGMHRISARADLLTPNLTEACLLTQTPYTDPQSMERDAALAFADQLLNGLGKICHGAIVITGIHLCDGTVANVGQKTDGTRFLVARDACHPSYPGTGDLFASVLLGAYLRSHDLRTATEAAADFIRTVIHASAQIPTPIRNGVALEPELWRLAPNHLCLQNN